MDAMKATWPRWLAVYVVSQAALYFTVKGSLASLGPALFLPVYLLGSSALLALVSRGGVRVSRDVVALGLMQAASAALWLSGLYLLPPATSASLNFLMPFVAVGLSSALMGEGLGAWEAAGAAVGGAGVGLYAVASVKGARSGLGVALTLANAFAWAAYSVYYRRFRDADPARLNATSLMFAGLASLPAVAVGVRSGLPSADTRALAYLVGALASSALGYASWTGLMRSTSVARATLSSYAVPASIAALQTALGQPVSPLQALGLGVMVLGASIAFREGRHTSSQSFISAT